VVGRIRKRVYRSMHVERVSSANMIPGGVVFLFFGNSYFEIN